MCANLKHTAKLEMWTQRVIVLGRFLKLFTVSLCVCVCVCVALWPNAGPGLLIHEVSRSHSTTHHIR